jgi:hypothetical protein
MGGNAGSQQQSEQVEFTAHSGSGSAGAGATENPVHEQQRQQRVEHNDAFVVHDTAEGDQIAVEGHQQRSHEARTAGARHAPARQGNGGDGGDAHQRKGQAGARLIDLGGQCHLAGRQQDIQRSPAMLEKHAVVALHGGSGIDHGGGFIPLKRGLAQAGEAQHAANEENDCQQYDGRPIQREWRSCRSLQRLPCLARCRRTEKETGEHQQQQIERNQQLPAGQCAGQRNERQRHPKLQPDTGAHGIEQALACASGTPGLLRQQPAHQSRPGQQRRQRPGRQRAQEQRRRAEQECVGDSDRH